MEAALPRDSTVPMGYAGRRGAWGVVEVAASGRYMSLVPSPAEVRLIAAAADGREADLRPDKGFWPPVSRGSCWGEERTVRAEVIYALCLGLRPGWPVHAKGVRLRA